MFCFQFQLAPLHNGNASQEFMVGWRPTFEGPLNTLAPEAQMLLARRAAAAAGEAADAKRRAIAK